MSAFEAALARQARITHALLRIVAGLLFAFHGLQLSVGLYADFRPAFGSQIWIGGWIELVGGALVMIGWLTRPAAFLCSGTMAVAYAQFHWKFRLGADFWPAMNHGELAALYCFIFLFLACAGPGAWSLDRGRAKP